MIQKMMVVLVGGLLVLGMLVSLTGCYGTESDSDSAGKGGRTFPARGRVRFPRTR